MCIVNQLNCMCAPSALHQISPLLQADKYGVPRICFVNKMDRMGANFHRTVEMIVTNLAATPLVLQVGPFLHGSQNICKPGEAARVGSRVFEWVPGGCLSSGGLCPQPPGSPGKNVHVM